MKWIHNSRMHGMRDSNTHTSVYTCVCVWSNTHQAQTKYNSATQKWRAHGWSTQKQGSSSIMLGNISMQWFSKYSREYITDIWQWKSSIVLASANMEKIFNSVLIQLRGNIFKIVIYMAIYKATKYIRIFGGNNISISKRNIKDLDSSENFEMAVNLFITGNMRDLAITAWTKCRSYGIYSKTWITNQQKIYQIKHSRNHTNFPSI